MGDTFSFRALYKQADIYLLDDPLSAVDPNVRNHLFKICIKGYYTKWLNYLTLINLTFLIGFLKDKTCVLVTHQMQFLADMDQIVVMDNVNIKILMIITYTVN